MKMNNKFFIDNREFEVIRALNRTSTRYLVIGGYAVLYYGCVNRQVNDLDIWIDNSQENARRVIEALQGTLSNDLGFSVEHLVKPKVKIDLSGARFMVELFTTVSGVSFEDTYSRKNTTSQDGEQIDIVSIDDLLTIKRQAVEESESRLQKELKDIGFLECKKSA